jgi:hypothetical protein
VVGHQVPHDDEQVVLVALHRRLLPARRRVLDGQRMQPQRLAEAVERLPVRVDQVDPGEPLALLGAVQGRGEFVEIVLRLDLAFRVEHQDPFRHAGYLPTASYRQSEAEISVWRPRRLGISTGPRPHGRESIMGTELRNCSVRDLLLELSRIEEQILATRLYDQPESGRAVNPRLVELADRERAITVELAGRRPSLNEWFAHRLLDVSRT